MPDGDAGLGRITTAPNGDMWFVERNAQPESTATGWGNVFGRITPGGVITTWWVPTSNEYSQLKDLDVDAAGNVWVLYDSGESVGRWTPATGSWTSGSLSSEPIGEHLRIGPDGVTPWITLGYDTHGVARVVGNTIVIDTHPACEGQISRGAQGTMWCTADMATAVMRIASDASSSQSYPLRADATYPSSIAQGSNGAVWFARDDDAGMFSSPGHGSVGWVDVGDSDAHYINVGDRVAPRSLTRGPDGSMWFASVGAAKGIGHVNASGIGAVTQVGAWHPEALTFSHDGALWFTDDDNNAIVRVARDRLQVTNLNVGGHFQIRPPKASRSLTLAVRKKGTGRTFSGRVRSSWPACHAGAVQLRRVSGRSSVLVIRTRAKANGSYVVTLRGSRARRGSYFTVMAQTAIRGTSCAAARSPKRGVH